MIKINGALYANSQEFRDKGIFCNKCGKKTENKPNPKYKDEFCEWDWINPSTEKFLEKEFVCVECARNAN